MSTKRYLICGATKYYHPARETIAWNQRDPQIKSVFSWFFKVLAATLQRAYPPGCDAAHLSKAFYAVTPPDLLLSHSATRFYPCPLLAHPIL